jgi:hypothetical protein
MQIIYKRFPQELQEIKIIQIEKKIYINLCFSSKNQYKHLEHQEVS